ncbi:hypothetical protein [Caldanaerobacter subterraneus]|uniref:Uncharacterized protein n=1 Tax=Caldanaerobacter subterraneus TaxID=911092 RepID=A0A7Y2PM89_9THEO|nr:hypothetical protein [Caldanaerobacter subterraneus]NNG66401.1 hypothetical protein [Caldanaerobacter subterraneus]
MLSGSIISLKHDYYDNSHWPYNSGEWVDVVVAMDESKEEIKFDAIRSEEWKKVLNSLGATKAEISTEIGHNPRIKIEISYAKKDDIISFQAVYEDRVIMYDDLFYYYSDEDYQEFLFLSDAEIRAYEVSWRELGHLLKLVYTFEKDKVYSVGYNKTAKGPRIKFYEE